MKNQVVRLLKVVGLVSVLGVIGCCSAQAQDSESWRLGVEAVGSKSPWNNNVGFIRGARITTVEPYSSAAMAHLRPGYFITRVNGHRVHNFQELHDEIVGSNGTVVIRFRHPVTGAFYNTAKIKLAEGGVLSAPEPDGGDY
jgi:S1-C subfamily serine protease